MIFNVQPTSSLKGKIELPSSKSYSIRAALIAACGGNSTIFNFSDCDDAKVSLRTAKILGAKVAHAGKNKFQIIGANQGLRGRHVGRSLPPIINVQESGTVLRFLLPLLALRGQKVKVFGERTLIGRPNFFLNETLRKMGVQIRGQGKKESVPIEIQGGELQGGAIVIDGTLSSQFISALFIACPQLQEGTRLRLRGKKIVSEDYITMTSQVLRKAGIKIVRIAQRKYRIPGRQTFQGLKNFVVPSDYGLAAFLMAGALLTKSDVLLTGELKDELIQADGRILYFLKKMGAKFQKTSRAIRIKGPLVLKGGNFSLKDCPDLVPIMSVLALFAKSKTRLSGIRHARAKESDRVSDLRAELLKIGAKIEETESDLIIHPREFYRSNALLDPRHDHRLAMAFAVLGLKVAVRIKDIECCSKSYPGFLKDFKALGAKVK